MQQVLKSLKGRFTQVTVGRGQGYR